jgi:CheY-like chemotaxis protein
MTLAVAPPILETSMPRALVVDDHAEVRTMISLVLRMNRFEVVEAANTAAAMRLYESDAGFDLAIVDMFLGEASGSDLIAALRARSPALPVIAVSGMTVLDCLSPGLSDVVCLQKPFRPADLLRAIEAAQTWPSPAAAAVR